MKIFQKCFLSSVVLGSFFIELPAQATPLLNEIYIGDSNFAASGHHNTSAYQDNFVELVGHAGESLNGYTVLQVDGAGQVVSYHTFGALDVMNTGTAPLDTGGEGYYFLAGQASAQSGTWYLLTEYTGTTDIDTNNDGTIDSALGNIIDSVGWASPSSGGFVYNLAAELLPSNISDQAIEGASRIVANTDSNQGSSWFYAATNPNLSAANGGDYAATYTGTIFNQPLNNDPDNLPVTTTPGWEVAEGEYMGHRNWNGVIVCPEPSSLILSGLLGLGAAFQRRRKRAITQ